MYVYYKELLDIYIYIHTHVFTTLDTDGYGWAADGTSQSETHIYNYIQENREQIMSICIDTFHILVTS